MMHCNVFFPQCSCCNRTNFYFWLSIDFDIAANSPPSKPWERAGSSSGPTPFKPPTPGSTSDVVEASGTAKPGEIVSTTDRNATVNTNPLGRPVPTRPWEQQAYGNNYGGISFSNITVSGLQI